MNTSQHLSKRKILLLSTSSDTGGGPQVVYNLALGLRQRGIKVAVALPSGGEYVERLQAAQIPIHILPLNQLRLKAFWRLRRLCRDQGFQLLHSHGKGAGLYSRISTMMSKAQHVHTFHGIHIALYSSPQVWLYRVYERMLSLVTECFVHVSETEYVEAKKQHLYGNQRYEIIYNGCQLPTSSRDRDQLRDDLRQSLNVSPDVVIMLCVARFDPVKNHAWLIEAFSRISDSNVHLLLVGDGDTKLVAEQLVQRLGLATRIHFLGNRHDVADIMRGSDIFVLASLREGLPITLQEAMLAELPLLGNNTIGINEPIQDGINGYLFQQPDIDSFVSVVNKLIMSSERRREMVRAGYEYATQNYSMTRFIALHFDLYNSLMETS